MRKEALAALGAIQGSKANRAGDSEQLITVREMVNNLTNLRTSVRVQAAEGLGQLCRGNRAAAKIAVPALIKSLNDYDTYVQKMAAESLGHQETVNVLCKLACRPRVSQSKKSQ